MSDADLARVRPATSAADVVTDARRVAVAAETEEALRSVNDWAAAHVSRGDDVSFNLLVWCRVVNTIESG